MKLWITKNFIVNQTHLISTGNSMFLIEIGKKTRTIIQFN